LFDPISLQLKPLNWQKYYYFFPVLCIQMLLLKRPWITLRKTRKDTT